MENEGECEVVPQTGLRTCDPVITNDVLYQLSYCGGPYFEAFSGGIGKFAPKPAVRPKTPAPDIGQRLAWQEKRWRPIALRRQLRPIPLFGRDVFEKPS